MAKKRRTHYEDKPEFHGDVAERDQLGNELDTSIRQEANSPNKPEKNLKNERTLREANMLTAAHDSYDKQYENSFDQAINQEGDLINDKAQNEALRVSKQAIDKLHAIKDKLAQVNFSGAKRIAADASNQIKKEKEIHDKMREAEPIDDDKDKKDKKITRDANPLEYALYEKGRVSKNTLEDKGIRVGRLADSVSEPGAF